MWEPNWLETCRVIANEWRSWEISCLSCEVSGVAGFETPGMGGLRPTRWQWRQYELSGWDACEFFIGIMLCREQLSISAWAAAHDFRENVTTSKIGIKHARLTDGTIWRYIADAKPNKLKNCCVFGDDAGYTGSYTSNVDEFVSALQKNAQKIVDDYKKVENIWEDEEFSDYEYYSEIIEEIRKRFLEFELIDEEQANMAVLLLVRDCGYAGGAGSRNYFNMRYNEDVARVISRAFFAEDGTNNAKEHADELDEDEEIEMPNLFDLALLQIGKDYCKSDSPKCDSCPISSHCGRHS